METTEEIKGSEITKPKVNGGMIAVAQQREIAEVQAAMFIARANPRKEKEAIDRILQACTRTRLAESALYQYSRGGADVTGPSIRLAEVMAQNWGNFQCGVRELEQDDEESTVEAYAWDLETNFRDNKVFRVPHIRHTKKGSYKLSDPRDIYEMVANQGARRKRACILAVIPGDVQELAIKQCEVTLSANAKTEVTQERLKNLVEKFGEMGVTREMIEARIQRHLDAMTPALLVQMGKIYNSLKDGMSSVADWFGEKPEAEKGTLTMDNLKAGKAEPPKAAPTTEEPKTEGLKTEAPKAQDKPKRDKKKDEPAGNPNYSDKEDPAWFGE